MLDKALCAELVKLQRLAYKVGRQCRVVLQQSGGSRRGRREQNLLYQDGLVLLKSLTAVRKTLRAVHIAEDAARALEVSETKEPVTFPDSPDLSPQFRGRTFRPGDPGFAFAVLAHRGLQRCS